MQILAQGTADTRRLLLTASLFRAFAFFCLFFFPFCFFSSPPALAASAECAALGVRLADIDKGFLFINAINRTEAETLINACGKDVKANPDDLLSRFYLGLGFFRLDRWEDAEGHLMRVAERYPLARVPYAAMTYHGFGVAKDVKRAEELLRRPEVANLPAAQLTLGNMLVRKGGKDDAQAALALWQAAAAKGYAEAERVLGFASLDGTPASPADPARAETYFRSAAEKGDLESIVQYIFILEEREGRSANYYKWLHAAAVGGDEWAMSQWAFALARGEGVPKDEKAAFALMAKAAEGSGTYGLEGLAHFYRRGIGTTKNPQKAFALYKACVERGDESSLYTMAFMLGSGEGVERDEKQAYLLMLQGAEKGDKNAQRWLGWYLFRLDQENMSEAAWNQAVHWSAKAAEGGDQDARYAAAYILLSHWATAEQEQKAIAELKKLSAEGHAPALLHMSYVYDGNLKSVAQNTPEARQWAEKALTAGAQGARSRLAGILFFNPGNEADLRLAVELWRGAAERENDPLAAYMLGQACHTGSGTPKDSAQAVVWLRKSIAGGYVPAQTLLAWILFYGAPGVPVDTKEALRLCKETIVEYETQPVGTPRLKLIDALNQAGFFHTILGDYAMAETYLLRATAEAESLAALGSQAFAQSGVQLANMYEQSGRLEQAKKLFQTMLPVLEREIAEAPENALLLYNYGLFLEKTNDFAGARKVFERIRDSLAKSSQDFSLNVFDAQAQLGRIEYKAGNPKKAAELLQGALAGYVKTGAPPTIKSIQALADLGLAETALGDAGAGIRDFSAAETLAVAAGLGTHPLFLAYAGDMAGKLAQLKRWEESRALFQRASAQYALRLDQQSRAGASSPEAGVAERLALRSAWIGYLDVLTGASAAIPKEAVAETDALNAEFFSVIQSATALNGADAVLRMASRFAAGQKGLGDPLARRGALLDDLARVKAALLSGFSQEGGENAPDPRTLVVQAQALTSDIAAVDRLVERDFPVFFRFTSSAPLPLAEARALLKPGEAVLVFAFGPKNGYAFALTPDKAVAALLPDLSEAKINADVSKLRSSLDPSNAATASQLPRLDVETAYGLYARLFGPLDTALSDVKHLFIVPAGALSGLSFPALLTKKPEKPIERLADYKNLPWLARSWSVTLLPSANSLWALRELARPSQADRPFLGVGDPKLGTGEGAASRGLAGRSVVTRGAVDLAKLRELPSLPDTADELREIAAILANKAPDSLLLSGAATEKGLRGKDLKAYAVIAFATHGLIAGELGGLAEPALVLTPPALKPGETAPPDNDGLLLGSEAAALSLDADWIILSACNTAAGDGKAGADGLSGLARSFFLAGARTLLVSNWPVLSGAAVELTTRMLKHVSENPELHRSEALRLAMLELADNEDMPAYFAHPGAWAPFVVVGDGGPLPRAAQAGTARNTMAGKP